ncbi:uncharacterized protein PAC_15680 [Phialocephala subalpina]|uniref:F-box domain-containing protein n=1 Tax=Phialocephala subalpina TaxID=576137 RepID=A0A1L7XL44_9HELO|nr:uncharacterized protein PAC_15680 [Phialocephala subalpina]
MLLQEINTDILRDIASSLASSPNTTSIDILSLAQTCRSLYAVARHFVPSSLYLEIPSSKYQLLKRMLNENPTYGLGVRSLNIQASKTTQESTRTQVFEFLQKLPNLTTLFALDPKFSVRLASLILSPELQFRTSLQKLLLGDRDLTSRELLDITRLPHLQHLVVRLMTDLDDHKEDEQPPIQSSNSLQHLKFRGCQIRSQTLSKILSSANSLQTLSCTAPLHGTITKSMLAGEISIAAKFSPEKILRCLMLVSRTLVNLGMHTNGQEWAGHDETRLNLSEFTALRSISASAEIFLPPLLLGISRDGLYRLLPPSLRNLKVSVIAQLQCPSILRLLTLLTNQRTSVHFWIQRWDIL